MVSLSQRAGKLHNFSLSAHRIQKRLRSITYYLKYQKMVNGPILTTKYSKCILD